MTIKERIENYKATSAADAYIIGITYHETIYELVIDEIPDFCFKDDHESKSHGGGRNSHRTEKQGRGVGKVPNRKGRAGMAQRFSSILHGRRPHRERHQVPNQI